MEEERGNRKLIEAVRQDDLAVRQSRLIEHHTDALRQIGEIARVNAHTCEAPPLRLEHLMCRADRIWDTRMDHIVGIDEEHSRLWIDLRITLECLVFILEEHDPAVRHRPRHGNAELLPRRDRCRHVDAADVCRTRAVRRRIHIVRPPRTKVRDAPPLCRAHDARRLCCNQGLMIDLCEQCRLDELRVDDRCDNRYQRLIGVDDRPLGHGIDVPTKAEAAQEAQELLREKLLRAEIVDVLIREREVLHELDHVLKPRKHRIAALVGNGAEEEVEGDAHIAVPPMKISVGHRHLVEIHHHG